MTAMGLLGGPEDLVSSYFVDLCLITAIRVPLCVLISLLLFACLLSPPTLQVRLHAPIWYILKPQKGSYLGALRSRYMLYRYMEP